MERQHEYMRDKSGWNDPLADQPVEHWDDDDFANLDDLQFRSASTASSAASWQQNQPNHNDRRDSLLSRLSARSDRGSNQDDQDWDVVVDQPTVNDAVAIAKRTGIPIPTNVPQSALVGGTIRKMPGKKIKQAMSEDWTEDLDFDGPLKPRQPPNLMDSMAISNFRLMASSNVVKCLPSFRLLSLVRHRMKQMTSVTISICLPVANSGPQYYRYKYKLLHLGREGWKRMILKRTSSSQKTACSNGDSLPLHLALFNSQTTLILNGQREVWVPEMQAQGVMADPTGVLQHLLLARVCQALSLKAKTKD
jgi:hypothetical protein